ncbi:MAG: dipeptidyl-peptidase 3 family protein, partial [Myxococcales bacterium]
TAADLRIAALAAQAAGADLGIGTVSLEYTLRALEAPLFDPRVDAQRTVHGADLTASAVNLYDGVTLRDLRGFHERYPANSRLVKEDRALTEEVLRSPAAASALDHAMAFAAPPQRAVLEPLAEHLRTGEPEAMRAAQRAWPEAAGPVDVFLGFLDRSADPRGRKALFGAMVGIADPDRTAALQALAQKLPNPAAPEALLLASAAGALRPLRSFALTVGGKSALFPAAAEAVAQLHGAKVLPLLAEPGSAADLRDCAPQLQLAFLALRELAGRVPQDEPALEEARADVAAHLLAAEPVPGLAERCRRVWPQFAATVWLASAASVPEGDRVEDDRQRAIELQIWWFTGKGALAERRANGRRYLAVPDAGQFRKAAAELLALLDEIARLGDSGRAADLLERHASHLDPQWRDEVLARLRAAGLPRRIAVLPPQLRAVVSEGRIADAEAVPIDDLDAEILRSWQSL